MDMRSPGPTRGVIGGIVLAALVVLVALPTFAASPEPSVSSSADPLASASIEPAASDSAATQPAASALAAPSAAAEPSLNEPAPSAEPRIVGPEPAKPPKADKLPKGDKVPSVATTVTGLVQREADADGDSAYTMTAGGTTYALEAGPSWYWGDNHPLSKHLGKTVTIVGEQEQGSAEIEVATINGVVIREPGKPPWAGGWKRVGEKHPGWSQEKWDRWQAKGAAKAAAKGTDCWPPGHCKPEAPTP